MLVSGVKDGFCLGDRYGQRAPTSGPLGRLHREFADENCRRGNTSILGLREGISSGQGDDYTFGIDYQWLDISRVPSGTYLVLNEVNRDRAVRETRYGNDASSIRISIQWPGGAAEAPATITRPPVVQILASCPDSARCDAPATRGRR